MGITSYAQNFEDVILWRALQDATPGFYIDIGAQDPVVDSVSKAFYEHGWRGIHVEPVTKYANLLRADRPDETVIQAVVAEQQGVVTFYEIPGGLSTACKEIAEEHQQKLGCQIVKTLVTAITLDDVLELAQSDTVHWLKIDVEGYERQVLSGWRNSPIRPWVIVIEATWPNTRRDTFEEWEDLVLAKGYELVYRDGLNRFYLHQSQSGRKERFEYPPNVFDGFQLSGTATSLTVVAARHLQQEYDRLRVEEEQLQQETQNLKAEIQKRALEQQTGQTVLQCLASQALEQVQKASVEHIKQLLERERAHAEQLEALHQAWRQAEREREQAHASEIAQLRQALEAANYNAAISKNEIERLNDELKRKDDEIRIISEENRMMQEKLTAQQNMSLLELLKVPEDEFVHTVYRRLLGREPDPAGLAHYTARVALGHSKMDVLIDILGSEEAKQRLQSGALNTEEALYWREVYQQLVNRKTTGNWKRRVNQWARSLGLMGRHSANMGGVEEVKNSLHALVRSVEELSNRLARTVAGAPMPVIQAPPEPEAAASGLNLASAALQYYRRLQALRAMSSDWKSH